MVHIGIIPDGNRRWCKVNHVNYTLDDLESMWYEKFIHLLTEFSKLYTQMENRTKNTELHLSNSPHSPENLFAEITDITFYVCSVENVHRNDKTKSHIFQFLRKILNFYENYNTVLKGEEEKYEDLICLMDGIKENTNIISIGNLDLIPEDIRDKLIELNKVAFTKNLNDENKERRNLFLGIAYSFEDDLKTFQNNYRFSDSQDSHDSSYCRYQSNIDVVIRTGGEFRLSGFFPTKTNYSELYFLRKFWPEFTVTDLYNIIKDFMCNRNRRFGK